MTTEPELPSEAVEYGAAHGFSVTAMTAGDRVRWNPGVAIIG
ncbi:homoserine kinase domain protein [Mycobacterium kansasii]|uniref:Homoserine kinase domain protein n=2 Tax=Mycobacterium kansasii TaxID=1768 RepID=A0A1V3XJZ1_MYCKA|nr:homoserine kinase domain protein [Mycobacterium kansasii]